MTSDLHIDDDVLYAAFEQKDMSFDGVAYIGVLTTRIYCRPGCPARMPLRRNVVFFRTADDAAQAGFRACKRCRPAEPPGSPTTIVTTLLAALAKQPDRCWNNRAVQAMGVDPIAARRHFQKRFGMSFLKYARTQRLAKAFASIGWGNSVLTAQLDASYDSSSGFRDAFARTFGTVPNKSRATRLLRASWIDTPLGPMIALTDDAALHMLEFASRAGLQRQLARYRISLNACFAPGETPTSHQVRRQLDSYFSGRSMTFVCALAANGTPFQRHVWTALQKIQAGETTTYTLLARLAGFPRAVRAVAAANAMNRCAIIVPCHRAIGSNGDLTGYAGGLQRKRWLLQHERVHAAQHEKIKRRAS